MERMINGELRETTLLGVKSAGFVDFDLVLYRYKGKEPVYYSFLKDDVYTPLTNGLTQDDCIRATSNIIARGEIKRKTAEDYIIKPKIIEPTTVQRTSKKIPTFMLINIINKWHKKK